MKHISIYKGVGENDTMVSIYGQFSLQMPSNSFDYDHIHHVLGQIEQYSCSTPFVIQLSSSTLPF
jgi:hypothetical protein